MQLALIAKYVPTHSTAQGVTIHDIVCAVCVTYICIWQTVAALFLVRLRLVV